MKNLKCENVKQVFIEYQNMSNHHRHVTATEWTNGEGVDISISDDEIIQLSHEDFDAMIIVVTALRAGLAEAENSNRDFA